MSNSSKNKSNIRNEKLKPSKKETSKKTGSTENPKKQFEYN